MRGTLSPHTAPPLMIHRNNSMPVNIQTSLRDLLLALRSVPQSRHFTDVPSFVNGAFKEQIDRILEQLDDSSK